MALPKAYDPAAARAENARKLDEAFRKAFTPSSYDDRARELLRASGNWDECAFCGSFGHRVAMCGDFDCASKCQHFSGSRQKQ